MTILICDNCGISYNGKYRTRNKHHFCCKDCFTKYVKTNKNDFEILDDIVIMKLPKSGKFLSVSKVDIDLLSVNWHTTNTIPTYAVRNVYNGNKHYREMLHRIILERKIGRSLKNNEFADHIDHNGLNNSRNNLRVASGSENVQNRMKTKKRTTSKFKGVFWHTRKNRRSRWEARINVIINGKRKRIHLGEFDDEKEAAIAYNKSAIEYFGEFACLNEIN